MSIGEGAERDTASEMTSATKLTKKSGLSAMKGTGTQGSRSSSPDKDAVGEPSEARQGEGDFDPDPAATQGEQMDYEDRMEEERMAKEQERKL